MGKILVGNDIHIGSVAHAEMDDYTDLIRIDKDNKNELYLLGDIIDRTNCKKRDVGYYTACIGRLKEHFNERYIYGNHEAINIGRGYQIITVNNTRVLLCHGIGIYLGTTYYPINYSEKETIKWSGHKLGRGFWSALGYKMWRVFSKHKGGYKKPSTKVLDRLVEICNLLSCHAVVFGHTHRSYDGIHHGKRIINTPKGITELYFD